MARQLPAGIVTFLFTDVEGSTRLLGELGAHAYAEALGAHRRLLRESIARHGGVEVDTQGDAFFLAFPAAPSAAAAALEAQSALATGRIRVRMGLHTGRPLVADEGYVGVDVHRAARIAAAGHGGQILLSGATRALLDGLELRDLGEHRLKDLSEPERIFQLGGGEFPPLKTLYRSNLPVPATPFLGREEELATVVALLAREDVRLLTVSGPGGAGKTRLALQAAAESAGAFPDGLTWVPLASARGSSQLLPAVAQALAVREEPGEELAETLLRRLGAERRLLLLDNIEQLLPEAAFEISRLLEAPTLKLLVTSRERLGVGGEHVWAVPPLHAADAVALFAARAQAIDPSFVPTPAIGDLCDRLDNMPLALELAATRTAIFTPEQLLERLGRRLDTLRGFRDADPRQQTLRATIAWSHDLLNDAEQQLFRRLSIFAGGCTFEAAESVCDADADTLQSLFDKSLLRRRDDVDGPRYWMLETIREYAEEQLAGANDAASVQARFVEFAHAYAIAADTAWRGQEVAAWHRRFRLELDNVRVALRLALDSAEPETALEIAAYVAWLWQEAGLLNEGCRWLETALARVHLPDPAVEGSALLGLGILSYEHGRLQHGEEYLRRSLPLLREGHREYDYVFALGFLASGIAHALRDEAEALLREAEANARSLADGMLIANILSVRAMCALLDGELDAAAALLEEALDELGSEPDHRVSLLPGLAEIEVARGRRARAAALLAEARGILEGHERPREQASVYLCSALVEIVDGEPEVAARYLEEGREAAEASGARRQLVAALIAQAGLHARRGETEAATESARRARSLLAELDLDWWDTERLVLDSLL